ncbi:MAG TPA: YchJ family metal-binding protein [Methylophilaceae bacterium]|nr:YchJ family metal-binding protein [Methylophilaceae bacterium]
MRKTLSNCPCGSGKSYTACCKPLHTGATAHDAEALMRSRYTAYTMGLEQYLLDTWHQSTRPVSLNLADDKTIKWLGLDIKRVEAIDEYTATVEFIARYKIGGDKAQRLHEISQFKYLDRWYYLTALDN